MEEKDYNYKKQPVTICNSDGEFHFDSYEEYKKYVYTAKPEGLYLENIINQELIYEQKRRI